MNKKCLFIYYVMVLLFMVGSTPQNEGTELVQNNGVILRLETSTAKSYPILYDGSQHNLQKRETRGIRSGGGINTSNRRNFQRGGNNNHHLVSTNHNSGRTLHQVGRVIQRSGRILQNRGRAQLKNMQGRGGVQINSLRSMLPIRRSWNVNQYPQRFNNHQVHPLQQIAYQYGQVHRPQQGHVVSHHTVSPLFGGSPYHQVNTQHKPHNTGYTHQELSGHNTGFSGHGPTNPIIINVKPATNVPTEPVAIQTEQFDINDPNQVTPPFLIDTKPPEENGVQKPTTPVIFNNYNYNQKETPTAGTGTPNNQNINDLYVSIFGPPNGSNSQNNQYGQDQNGSSMTDNNGSNNNAANTFGTSPEYQVTPVTPKQ